MGSFTLPPVPTLPIPWLTTPLIESPTLSRHANCRIFLKLENLQPAASFKSRGIGNLILSTIQARASSPNSTPSNLHFYCSSGGNAGIAAVTAAKTLGYPCSVVVPTTTDPRMVAKVKRAGATEVVLFGDSWFFADRYLREVVMVRARERGEEPVHVPPFDDERIWQGASYMVEEIQRQLLDMDGEVEGGPPEGIVCSVGGGGLYIGMMLGLEKCGWEERVKVAAVETQGAHSLRAALDAGKPVTLEAITSIAKSLGAVRVAGKAFEYAQKNQKTSTSLVVSDAEACMACVKFADDERILVEPACGASLAVVYSPKKLREAFPGLTPSSKIVVVVCGGNGTSLRELAEWEEKYGVEAAALGA